MSTLETLAVVFLLAAVPFVVIRAAAQQQRQLERHRDEAMAAFRSTVIDSDDPQFRFSGATSTIVKQEEFYDRRQVDGYALTLFARNEFGEYLMFKAAQTRPYVKHVEHRIAKVVLKAAYVPPAGQA